MGGVPQRVARREGAAQVSGEDSADMQRMLGQHGARLDEMERWRGHMEDRMNARFDLQDAQLARINTILDKLAGGWKLIMILGGSVILLSDGAVRLYRLLLAR